MDAEAGRDDKESGGPNAALLDAAAAAATSGSGAHHVIDGDMVFRLADRIEIAKLQLSIYNQLKTVAEQKERSAAVAAVQSKDAASASAVAGAGGGGGGGGGGQSAVVNMKEMEKEDRERERRVRVRMAVGELDRELFDLDNLYIYAQTFSLWEECLAIIHFSERKDQEKVVRALWKNMIRQEIQSCEAVKLDWSLSVRAVIIRLAQKYADVPFMFPLEFICKELEEYNTRYVCVSGVCVMLWGCVTSYVL